MFEGWRRKQRPGADSEVELVRAVAAGNAEAAAVLYQRHGPLIYRFCLRMSQDQSIAEEVTQDVFLSLLKQANRFDPDQAALPTWLCGIARRLIWKRLEHHQRHLPIEAAEDEAAPEEDDPASLLSRQEAVEAVRREVAELPLDAREVILLCEFEEMSYEDASIILSVPVGTVRSRLHRAKRRLALLLRDRRNG